MENNIIRFKCPHCQLPLAFRKPENGYGVNLTCPQCHNAIKIKVRERAIRLPEQGGEQAIAARLLIIDGPQSKYIGYPLRYGDNIIGRDDLDIRQDIAIRGDMAISRRSANLEVNATPGGGYSYMLRILNARNPVYVNGTPIHTGQSIILRLDDVVQMGSTKLVLKG